MAPSPTSSHIDEETPDERFRTLLEKYQAPLLNRIRLMMGVEARRRAESGDFLHEIIVEMLEKPEHWETERDGEFLRRATWLVRNRVVDQLRRKRRR